MLIDIPYLQNSVFATCCKKESTRTKLRNPNWLLMGSDILNQMIVGLYIPLSSVISCIYLFMKESLVYTIIKFLAQKWIIIAYFVILIRLSSLMQRKPHHTVGCAIWCIAIIAHVTHCSIVIVSSQSDTCSRIIIIVGSSIS